MDNWNNSLKKHITLIHSKGGQHKTTLNTSANMYLVVTRVNYLSIKLWVEHINEAIKNNPTTPKTEPINKINWLVMLKSYRRDMDNKFNSISNLK